MDSIVHCSSSTRDSRAFFYFVNMANEDKVVCFHFRSLKNNRDVTVSLVYICLTLTCAVSMYYGDAVPYSLNNLFLIVALCMLYRHVYIHSKVCSMDLYSQPHAAFPGLYIILISWIVKEQHSLCTVGYGRSALNCCMFDVALLSCTIPYSSVGRCFNKGRLHLTIPYKSRILARGLHACSV